MPFPGGSGGSASTSTDWAAHADAATVAADWTSTSEDGGATGIDKADRSMGVRMLTNTDGTNDTDGNRVQGLVQPVAAGDFIVGLRLALDRPGEAFDSGTTAVAVAVVFVDGEDVSTSSWYGAGPYISDGGGSPFRAPSILRFQNEADANRFESYAGFGTILNTPALGFGPFDFFVQRDGTTLTIYMGPAQAVPQALYSWTVTAGAGRVGVRLAHQAGVAHDIMINILAFRSFEEVPW